eukprot:10904495-Prorocentrum_lima.AAC.1
MAVVLTLLPDIFHARLYVLQREENTWFRVNASRAEAVETGVESVSSAEVARRLWEGPCLICHTKDHF